LPFEGKLEAKNLWAQHTNMVPWRSFEIQYATEHTGTIKSWLSSLDLWCKNCMLLK